MNRTEQPSPWFLPLTGQTRTDWLIHCAQLDAARERNRVAYVNGKTTNEERRKCATCRGPLLPKAHRYCSRKCFLERGVGKKEVRQCAQCGRDFTAYKYQKTRCCSHSCGRTLFLEAKRNAEAKQETAS